MRTQQRRGLGRPPPDTISSPLYQRILQYEALSSCRQQGKDVRSFAVEFSGAAEGLGYNDEALKDLFNSALDEPLSWWRMSGLDHLTFGEFVEALARSPAKVAGVPQVVGDKAAAPPVAADGAAVPLMTAVKAAAHPGMPRLVRKLEDSPMRSVRAADFSPTKPSPVVLEAMVERARSAPEPAPIREPTESAPIREPTESAPIREPTQSAPFREPTQSAPEPAPPREPTESAPEPAPPREPTEPAPFREPTEPAPFREPTQSAPFREPTQFAPFREPTQSAPEPAPFREPTQSAPEPAPFREPTQSAPEPALVREHTDSAPEPAPVWEPMQSTPVLDSGLGTHRARSRASPTLAPLCAHCSRPSSTPRAWPTSLLDIFLFSVCGASGIRSLKGGLCHGPAGVPRLATRCLCVLSTWLVVCLVPCAPMSIVCPLPSCYLIIVSVAPAVSPSLPSFVSLYSLLVSAVLCWSVVFHVSSSCEFHVDCAPVFCLPACLFFPFGVVFVVHLFHFIIKTLIFLCIWVLDLISPDIFLYKLFEYKYIHVNTF